MTLQPSTAKSDRQSTALAMREPQVGARAILDLYANDNLVRVSAEQKKPSRNALCRSVVAAERGNLLKLA